jgi:hypothetical protein
VTDYWTADIWKIEIDLTGHDRIKTAYEWRTQVDEFKLYRRLDPNFGFLSHTAISLVDGINLFPPGFDPSGLLVDIETTFDSDTTTFSVAGDQTTFDTSEASSAADVLINELSTHHSPHKVLLGELNYAVARDTTGAIIYEVIYREILDPHRKADFLVPYPQANSAVQLLSGDGITTTFSLIHTGQTRRTIAVYEDQVQVPFEELNVSGTTLTFNTPPAAGSEIRVYYLTINAPTTPQASAVEYLTPASINNWRRDLIDKFGFADPELLPLWQRSEQVLGDPTSIPGYIPVIPLAYAQPGEAKHIIDGITSDPVAWCTFKIDRYHIQNEVDDIQDRINFDVIDNQTTWNADTTTYDNDTTLFDIATETTFDGDTTRFDVEEIGRVDKYIKFPPGDLLGVS